MDPIQDYLQQQLTLHQIQASESQIQHLVDYVKLLQHWNKVFNLIANDNTQHIIDRHIIDSLLVLPYIKGQRIIDVGTGAGLPGIPLAIMLPESHISLLDSNGKKTRFVTQAKAQLRLPNIEVINKRVEEYQPAELFDIVTSRAFAELSKMLTLTKHLCKPEGSFIALKGIEAQKEAAELPPGFRCELIERLPFADQAINRKVIIVKIAS